MPAVGSRRGLPDDLINILLGENWSEAVPFLQWYCLIGMMAPLQTSSAQAINASCLSGIYLKIMSFKRTIGLILLVTFTVLFESVFAIVIAAFLVGVIAVFIHMWYNLKLFRYTFYEQSSDVIKNIIATIVVLFSYLCVKSFLPSNPYMEMLMVGSGSMVVYLFILFLLKSSELKYVMGRVLKNNEE